MKCWNKWTAAACASLLMVVVVVAADDKKEEKKKEDKPATGGLVIVDARGKEQKLKTWEFVTGTRRLEWLAPPEKKDPKDKEGEDGPRRPAVRRPQGPEALVFRDENSTGWVDGVLTLIPLDRLRGLDFDEENQTATVRVAAGDKPDADVTLTGTTKYARMNKVTIEAEVDKGELGVAAVKYQGGVKGGIKGIRFPSAKAAPAPAGRPAQVTVNLDGKKQVTEKVTDLQVLYRGLAGGEKLSPILLFKKTVKVPVDKLQKLVAAGGEGAEWQLTLKGGSEETFTLLTTGELDGVRVRLEGLLGKVPAGYKLFPLHTVAEVQFDEAKPDKPEKTEKTDKTDKP
jgi:hypothetical protein